LHYGLAAILGFVGFKMVIAEFYKVPMGVALGIVAALLASSMIASVVFKPKKAA
jgi:tellurite resistance protein TerC